MEWVLGGGRVGEVRGSRGEGAGASWSSVG